MVSEKSEDWAIRTEGKWWHWQVVSFPVSPVWNLFIGVVRPQRESKFEQVRRMRGAADESRKEAATRSGCGATKPLKPHVTVSRASRMRVA